MLLCFIQRTYTLTSVVINLSLQKLRNDHTAFLIFNYSLCLSVCLYMHLSEGSCEEEGVSVPGIGVTGSPELVAIVLLS